jgi:hypothetical protein
MATTAPLPSDIDTWVAGQPGLVQFIGNAVLNPGQPVTAVIVGWTRNDNSQRFQHIADPRNDPQASALLQGLVAAYGAAGLLVRVYTFTFSAPAAASLAAPANVQTVANNPANWAVI